MEVTPQDVIDRASYLLEEFGWCRGFYARDKWGDGTPATSPEAASFCAIGAIQRASLDLGVATWDPMRNAPFLAACQMVYDETGRPNLTFWNDVVAEPGEVRAVFRKLASTDGEGHTSEQQVLVRV